MQCTYISADVLTSIHKLNVKKNYFKIFVLFDHCIITYSLIQKTVGSPHPKNKNLRKNISDLKRRSMPVFEMKEDSSPNVKSPGLFL